MHNAGWIKVDRALWDDPLFRGHPSRVGAWLWLVGHARWKPGTFDINGHIVVLERGQLCVSRFQLADALGWSESAVDRFLTRLKSARMIERNSEHGRSIITICDYERFQGESLEAGQATEHQIERRADSNRTAKEERKKDKNISSNQPTTPSRANVREAPPNKDAAEPLDGQGEENQGKEDRSAEALALVADAAGLALTEPKRKTALAHVVRWLDDWPDCDPAADLVAPIRRFLAEKDGPTHSLARFDAVILDRKARAKPKPAIAPAKPGVPRTHEGEQERRLRAALRDAMGDAAYVAWIEPTALALNCESLTVTCRSAFHAEHLGNHHLHDLRTKARAVGGSRTIEVLIKTEGKL